MLLKLEWPLATGEVDRRLELRGLLHLTCLTEYLQHAECCDLGIELVKTDRPLLCRAGTEEGST